MTDKDAFSKHGRAVIALEAEAVKSLENRMDDSFESACRIVLETKGRLIVVGMGKSGHIGSKIAATLASTGTPSFFVHPGEASHGDLGMITVEDTVLAISNSGETAEILTILPIIKRLGVKLISMTGNPESSLGKQSEAILNVGVEKEACPLNLAPTSSTTVTLAMGDALAVALYKSRGFTKEDFARSHPSGRLGRRLLLYVKDIMHTGENIPTVNQKAELKTALLEMTGKGLGMVGIVDDAGVLVGILTDGDLRRTLNQGIDIYKAYVKDVMTQNPKTTTADRLAAELVQQMRESSINGLFAVDEQGKVVGALNMHDLLRTGIV